MQDRDHRPQLAHTLFKHQGLERLQTQLNSMQALNKVLASALPKQLSHLCHATQIHQGMLVILVASAAQKRQLEFERISILSKLRQSGFASLSSIEFKIDPNLYRSQAPTSAQPINRFTQAKKEQDALRTENGKRKMSAETAANLLALAENAPPKMKASLERLAKLKK